VSDIARGTTVIYPASGGILAELIAKKDFSDTLLGPREAWPPILRTSLAMILASRFASIIFWGPDFSVLYNDTYVPIFARKHPHVLGRPGREAWSEVWDVIRPLLEGVLMRGETTYSKDQLLVLERKGWAEECYFTWSYSPIRDAEDRVGGVLTTIIETTENVLGERRLLTLRALGEEAAEARAFEAACARATETLGSSSVDVPWALLFVATDGEPTLMAATGIDRDHPLAEAARWRLSEASDVVVVEGLAPYGITAKPWPEKVDRAVVVPLRSSSERAALTGWLVAGTSPRLELDAAYRSFFGLAGAHIASALAAAKAYEEERRRAEELAAIDRAKTAFFSNVSHEFRTPLTLMLGPLEDALERGQLAGADLETAHRNALRLLRLVNALLDFSRIEAGRATASFERVELGALTRDLASVFRSAFERAGLRLDVETAAVDDVWVDREMWEKVILNLLSNALKFTFSGGVTVRVEDDGDVAVVYVTDTGVGVAEDEVPRLFERFHRIEGARARTHEGSGIGLALVRDLVTMHGGAIRATSAVGRGTTFEIRLRKGAEHLPSDQLRTRAESSRGTTAAAFVAEALRWVPATTTEQAPTGTGVASAGRIVVADDNADMREYVTRVLADRWTVEAVGNGVEALAAIEREPPDLVLSDVMMPNLGGFALLRALRGDPALAAIPVVLLSARAGEDARVEGLEAGADDYLVKPFSARELVARVATHVALGRFRRNAESERSKLYALLRNVPVGIIVYEGPELRIAFMNDGSAHLVARRDALGRPLLEAFPELRGQPIVEELLDILRGGAEQRLVEAPVTLRIHGKEEPHFFTTVRRPLREADGKIVGVISVGYDVTDTVQTRRELERAARAKDEFLAMLGHELRNPLAPMVSALELAKKNGATPRLLAVLDRQTAHLKGLVDDLLDVSRITNRKLDLAREPVELAHVVERALEVAQPLLEERKQQLAVDVAPGLIVDGDRQRLAQVFANLLTNAAKYSDLGRDIRIAARAAGASVVVDVVDHGMGIAPEMVDSVFDAFVQQPQGLDRSRGGLGLGLMIVRSLVEMHGGRVAVKSAGRDCGSTFTVTLPLASSRPVASPPASTSARPERGRGTVLVVDDNVDAAEMVAAALEMLGYRTEVAHDGAAAREAFDRVRPDVALLDIGLPDVDGYTLASKLRATEHGGRARLIALTGYGQPGDRARSAAAGFDTHLVKPVDLTVLARALASGKAPASS